LPAIKTGGDFLDLLEGRFFFELSFELDMLVETDPEIDSSSSVDFVVVFFLDAGF
jgi:hypothetical protein